MRSEPLDYLEQEVFPKLEDFQYVSNGEFTAEDLLDHYEVEPEESLLTEDPEELRSYTIDYRGYDFSMSVEIGNFGGKRSIGISADNTEIQDDDLADLVSDIADSYNSWAQPLGHGEYILDIEDW